MITYDLRASHFTYREESAKWQVIYKKDGLDYCRESYGDDIDILALQDIILKELKCHGLSAAEIQYF